MIDKHGVPIGQWALLYQALLAVSMNTIALRMCVCVDDWTSQRAIIASNDHFWIKPILICLF